MIIFILALILTLSQYNVRYFKDLKVYKYFYNFMLIGFFSIFFIWIVFYPQLNFYHVKDINKFSSDIGVEIFTHNLVTFSKMSNYHNNYIYLDYCMKVEIQFVQYIDYWVSLLNYFEQNLNFSEKFYLQKKLENNTSFTNIYNLKLGLIELKKEALEKTAFCQILMKKCPE